MTPEYITYTGPYGQKAMKTTDTSESPVVSMEYVEAMDIVGNLHWKEVDEEFVDWSLFKETDRGHLPEIEDEE